MMRYSMGNLAEWKPVGAGELVSFALGDAKVRTVQFDLISDCQVGVFATRPFRPEGELPEHLRSEDLAEATWLVGFCPGGQASIRFATSTDVGVYCQTEEGGSVFLRFGVDGQVRPARDIPSFVNPAPRPAGPADELRRVMRIMHLNQARREQQLLDGLAVLQNRVDELQEAQRAPQAATAAEATQVAAAATSPSTVPAT